MKSGEEGHTLNAPDQPLSSQLGEEAEEGLTTQGLKIAATRAGTRPQNRDGCWQANGSVKEPAGDLEMFYRAITKNENSVNGHNEDGTHGLDQQDRMLLDSAKGLQNGKGYRGS